MRSSEGIPEREDYRDALRILFEAFDQGKLEWGWTPPTEDSRAHREHWLVWAQKGRSSARLRQGICDTLEAMADTPSGWRSELFKRVRRETGVDLDQFRSAHLRRVASIVERGKVRSLSEFAALRSHVDELEGDPAREHELNVAYRLLGEFESRLSKRGAAL